MKLRRLIASCASACVAVSAMTVVSSAAVGSVDTTNYMREADPNGTVFILADKDADPNWSADTGISPTEVYGVTYHIEFNADEVADESAWIGGGIGANSQSTGWLSNEWGRNEKPIIADLENGTVTWLSETPVFAETDTYCQFWIQAWGGTIVVKGADILAADGSIIDVVADAPAADGDTTVAISYVADGPAYTYVVPAGIDTLKVQVAVSEADGDAFGWNDWCGAGIAINDEVFYQWGGAQVSWGWDATGDEVNDSEGGVNGDTWAGTIGADGGEISVPVSEGDVVDFYCLSWDSYTGVQYTLTFEAPSAGAPAADEDTAEDDADEDTAEDDADEDTADEDDAAAEAFTLEECYNNGTVILVADDGQNAYATSNGIDILDVYGYRVTAQFPMAEINDEGSWIGGGMGTNSNSTGWAATEWGKASGEKPIVCEFDDQGVTVLELTSDTSLFAADDAYAQLWIQCWGGTMNIISVEVLGADGDVIAEAVVGEVADVEAPAEEETPAEEAPAEEAPAAGDVDAETDSSKGSPDTGVEDVAVVAGLAIVAAGAVLVSKKRK